MPRRGALVATTLALAALVGCGDDGTDGDAASPDPGPETTVAAAETTTSAAPEPAEEL